MFAKLNQILQHLQIGVFGVYFIPPPTPTPTPTPWNGMEMEGSGIRISILYSSVTAPSEWSCVKLS
jgi:hypothetical protein